MSALSLLAPAFGKKNQCVVRESNPGLSRGRGVLMISNEVFI